MFVPRKPHLYVNEYHTVFCGLSGILWHAELREGKDAPKDLPKDPNEHKYGPTVPMLLWVCKSIFVTGKVVVLDRRFCVLSGIIHLEINGVFMAALIKKETLLAKVCSCRRN